MEFATGALGTLLPKLGQLLQDEYNLHKGTKKNIEFLKRELESIHAALRNVGEVPLEQLSDLVRIWARDAREVSYDMEDIVDTFLVRVQGANPPSKKSSKRFIKKMKDFVTKAKTQHEIGQEIKNIKERLMELAERRKRYEFAATNPSKTCDVDPRTAFLYTKAADLVGIDEVSEELIMRLTEGDVTSTQKQRVVSVVGFGGLGKTTLAKAVYDDKFKGQFDCTAFVPVGRTPDLMKVFKDILTKLDNEQHYMNFNFDNEMQFIDKLRDFLQNKRYFIVIDDVWDKKYWEIIKLALVENNRGSRVIITTRTHEVAKEAGGVYELQPLSLENSRKLFFARIFGGESKYSNHQPDDEVCDKILRKCGGIPLAIITMASLLVGKPEEEWSEVHRSIGFGNKENQQVTNTMKILSFSYYDLASHLRTCLLYLSVFPEDYFIEKGPLIWMWIAEGFVHKKQGKSLFETGEEYFNELVNRSMIQLAEEFMEYHYKGQGCQVHDMVLDLIRSISSEENFVTILDSSEGASSPSQGKVRRLVQNNKSMEAHVDTQHVRSFISYGCNIDKGVPFSGFKHIRVLAIGSASSKDFESSHLKHLQDLLHLRYLRLSGDIFNLPDGIGKLKFLRILDELKIEYHIRDFEAHRRFVKELGSLRELRVLCIRMTYMQLVPYQVESLRNLEKMEHLTLLTYPFTADTAAWEAAGFLLSQRLRQLFLYCIRFSRFPSVCINPSRLPNLSHLRLCLDYIDEQDLRILGGLPELRYLYLDVYNTMDVVCNIGSTTSDADAAGASYLFQKLRRCIVHYFFVRVLPSKDDDCGSGSCRMFYMDASMLLSSQSGKGVAPTLMPSAQVLKFSVHVPEFMDICDSFSLEYFASVRNVSVELDCAHASAALVGEAEAALRHAAYVHPNRPKLEVRRTREDELTPAPQDQEVQSNISEED
ncbi:unnamed protein product [Urochloa decumbens]|uniref:Uncharacterized protein n=1 Tax=Urochloa decumbens TaxID=240449 RepID=A0ABC9ASY9_9POAL